MSDWHVVDAATDAILIIDQDRRTVCEISREEGVIPDDEANARLIAAAPALLAACEKMLWEFPDLDEVLRDGDRPRRARAVLDAIRAAIKAAKGE